MTPGAKRRNIEPGRRARSRWPWCCSSGAGLTLISFGNLLAVDPGFSTADVLTVEFALPDGRYDAAEARRALYARAFAEIQALPSVESIGAAQVTPLTGNNWSSPLQRVDRPLAAGQRPPEVGWQMASRGYFGALRIPLRSGRLFEPRDATGPAVVIISQSAADSVLRRRNGRRTPHQPRRHGSRDRRRRRRHPARIARRRSAAGPVLSVRTRKHPVGHAVHSDDRRP